MGISEHYVTEWHVVSTGYVMIGFASTVFLGRFGLRLWKSAGVQWEDFFVVFSWLSFVTMAALYIIAIPGVYRLTAVMDGAATPYAAMEQEALFLKKVFFSTTMLLWLSLWSVKLSLLVLYRRLLALLSTELRLWWGILIFTILSFIGCIISNVTSCGTLSAWFSMTGCSRPRDIKAQIASLYFSYAVDVLTDLMIMALPSKLLWSLRLPLAQKLSVASIFSIGFICIIVATVRVVQIGSKAKNSSTPSSSWLAFWGIIETGIAVIIGCLPALAIIYRKERSARRTSFKRYSSMEGNSHKDTIPLSNAPSGTKRNWVHYDVSASTPPPTASKLNGIAVTQSVAMDEEYNPRRPGR
ncbi:hypothetical protein PABG_00457 [Paracoccidioides brasiliensis Pb03]|nr:hypothetical protein PABG_00457 [Paracoccidioides brasiliensis Pb03]